MSALTWIDRLSVGQRRKAAELIANLIWGLQVLTYSPDWTHRTAAMLREVLL